MTFTAVKIGVSILACITLHRSAKSVWEPVKKEEEGGEEVVGRGFCFVNSTEEESVGLRLLLEPEEGGGNQPLVEQEEGGNQFLAEEEGDVNQALVRVETHLKGAGQQSGVLCNMHDYENGDSADDSPTPPLSTVLQMGLSELINDNYLTITTSVITLATKVNFSELLAILWLMFSRSWDISSRKLAFIAVRATTRNKD